MTTSSPTPNLAADDASGPIVRIRSISITFSGDPLDRTRGNWIDWSTAIQFDLALMALSNHIDSRRHIPPDESTRPTSYDNWLTNDLAVRAFLAKNCVKTERELFVGLDSARAYWRALEAVHLAEGPVKQMDLIRGSFSTPIPRNKEQLTIARRIDEDIRRAFDMPGGLSKDTFSCIMILTMLGEGQDHTRAIILRDMQSATADKPFLPRHIFSYLESDTQLLLGSNHAASGSSNAIALAAKTLARTKSANCSNCAKPYHLHPYCIAPGGGMAGRTVEESKERRQKDKEAARSPSASVATAVTPKHKVQVTTSAGQAYMMEVNDAFLSTGTLQLKAEFAGVIHSTDALEWDAFDGFANFATVDNIDEEEENIHPQPIANISFDDLTTSIDWDKASTPIDLAKVTVTALNQNSQTNLSLANFPFWVDSGASVYITPDKSDFYMLKRIKPKEVGGVGKASVTAIGVGNIHLKINGTFTLILRDALYIPGATVRLISVSALTRDTNINILFDNKACYFLDRNTNQNIAQGTLTSKRLYSLNLHNTSVNHAFITTPSATIDTWHRRLGHANFQVVHEMARKGLVKGMPTTFSNEPSKCESCIFGKQTKTPVPKKREEGPGHRATRRLEKVWVDLTGPTAVTSRNGNNYVMNILDDFTSFAWTIPLPNKAEAYPRLKEWELARENETGLKVSTYRVDNGELKSDRMDVWLRSRGVQQEFTAPYTSAHIGRVERLHRTLMGKARAMRTYSKLPPFLWEDLYLTSTHLHVRTLARSATTTPFEEWYSRKPDYSYIREIGCNAYVLIQNRHNPKIYERSAKCTLVGYDMNSKAYLCWNRDDQKMYKSYHVQFIESHETTPTVPISPETPVIQEPSTIDEIFQTASTKPLPYNEDEEEYLPSLVPNHDQTPPINHNLAPPIPDSNHDQAPPVSDPAPIILNPAPDNVRRSGRVPKPIKDFQTARLDKAIQDSRTSAQRIAEAQSDKRKTLQDLREEEQRNDPKIVEKEGVDELCEIYHQLNDNDNINESDHTTILLAAIADASNVDPKSLNFEEIPTTWEQARSSRDAAKWEASYRDELKSLLEMGVYDLIPPTDVPRGCKVRKGRPVFHLKRNEKGEPVRWKVRLVFKGFEQIYGKDYTSTTSPTARMESWRILLHIAASKGWDAQQIDVKTAFLYGLLPDDETQYMQQPLGFEEQGKETWIWRLKRGLYGMKQSVPIAQLNFICALNGTWLSRTVRGVMQTTASIIKIKSIII